MDVYEEIVQRNWGVYSKDEQTRLKKGSAAVVGIGCDGGIVAAVLARMGVGRITLIDFDTYERSNQNRQPLAFESTRGKPKVLAAAEILLDANPAIEVVPVAMKLGPENARVLLQGHDVIVQCMDQMAYRIVAHWAAKELETPIVTMTGQPPYRAFVSTCLPDGPLYEELFGLNGVVFRETDISTLLELQATWKRERARRAAERGADRAWAAAYVAGNSGWGITPERSWITGTLQAHEAIRVLLGYPPRAVAPRAYVVDLQAPDGHVVQLVDSLTGSWDYRDF